MSVEALILLALFVLLPLIERLVLAARRRRERAAAERPEAEVQRPPFMGREEVREPVVRPEPPAAPRAEPNPVVAKPRLRAPHRPAAVAARARAAKPGSPYRRDLRRAMVMAAVLGPCRALSPYDDPRS